MFYNLKISWNKTTKSSAYLVVLALIAVVALCSSCVGAKELTLADFKQENEKLPALWVNKVEGSVLKQTREPDGSYVYLLTSENKAYMVDMKTGKIIHKMTVPFQSYQVVEMSADKGQLVSMINGTRIIVIDLNKGKVLLDFDSGDFLERSFRNVFTRQGNLIYCDQREGTFSGYDAITHQKKWSYGDKNSSVPIFMDDYYGRLFIHYFGSPLIEINPTTGQVIHEYPLKYGATLDNGNLKLPIMQLADPLADLDFNFWVQNAYAAGFSATRSNHHLSIEDDELCFYGKNNQMSYRMKMPYKDILIGGYQDLTIIQSRDAKIWSVLDLDKKRVIWQEKCEIKYPIDIVYQDGLMFLGHSDGKIELRDLRVLK